jgi:hypothetical protein
LKKKQSHSAQERKRNSLTVCTGEFKEKVSICTEVIETVSICTEEVKETV